MRRRPLIHVAPADWIAARGQPLALLWQNRGRLPASPARTQRCSVELFANSARARAHRRYSLLLVEHLALSPTHAVANRRPRRETFLNRIPLLTSGIYLLRLAGV